MTTNANVTPLSKHDARRLATASLDVMQRNSGMPELATHAATMVPVASGVLIAIQDLEVLKGEQVKLLAESNEQRGQLHGLMLRWSGTLVHDLEGYDPGAFVRDPDLSFDVLQKAIGLTRYIEQQGAGLPYRAALIAELDARIESADGTARSAYVARVALQEKQRETRELMARFYKELVSLRRTLRATLGSTHLDYRRLRASVRAAEPALDEAPVTVPSETGS